MAADKKSNPVQIAQAVLDESAQAVKVKVTDTELSIELSADDGDSVLAIKPLYTNKVAVDNTKVTTTVLLTTDAKQLSEIVAAVNVTDAITATALEIKLEFSPSDTDSVWIADGTAVPNVVVPASGSAYKKHTNIGPWRRVRAVVTYTDFTSGEFDLYVNAR